MRARSAPDSRPATPAGMVPRERLALLLLGAGGAAFLPGALDRFLFPKLVVAAAGTALALTIPVRGALPRKAKLLLSASAVLLVAAALSSVAPLGQLIGRPPRYEGAIALTVYLGSLVAGARLLGPDRAPGSVAWLLDVLSVVAIVVGIEAALEATGARPLVSNVSRPGGLLGNASDQGAWAVLALGPLTAAGLVLRERLHVAGAIAAAVTLATSGSRGALAGALVLAATLAICRPNRALLVPLVCGLAATTIGVLALPTTRARVLGTSALSGHTTTGRELLWSETLSLIVDHPLLGVGPSGYVDAIPVYHDSQYEREVGPQNPPDSPHDWILQAASAGGPVLALLALALAGLTLQRGWRAMRREPNPAEQIVLAGVVAGLCGYAVTLLFHFTNSGTTPLAALYAGALLATGRPTRTAVSARNLAAAGYVALALLLSAAAVAEIPLRSALISAAAGNLKSANRDFRLARDLRPWDRGVAQIATHAYAVLAGQRVPGAAALGAPWSADELSAYPDSIQGLKDAATLDSAAGHHRQAAWLRRRARRLEPHNPTLY